MPLNVLGSLRAPALSWDTEAETLRDEIEGTVTSLLGLVGITADPLSSREHVLLSNLIENAWRAGRDLDLGTLIGEIQTPPLRKLGVFEIDAFFPPKDRTELALKLNALIASPAFAAWGEGAPLDPQALLFTPEGKPRAAIVYTAHLSDEERMFVTTLVFAKLVTWMRGQSGTSDLRALAYMDEVAGYVPPTAAPPAKKPILTILKQGRAFGLGLVLSTQNPVDLDYKAMSNAGTWLVGRLQTENDKARVLEGLRSAAGGADISALDSSIGALQKRQFMLVSAQGLATAGLLDAVGDVVSARAADEGAGAAADEPGAPPGRACRSRRSRGIGTGRARSPDEAVPAAALADDETSVAPAAAAGITVSYLDPAAPWAAQVGATAGVTRLHAFIATRVSLRYDDTAAGIDEQQEFEALYGPLDGGLDLDAETVVDFDDRDFRPDVPAGATYVLPAAPVAEAKFFAQASKDVQGRLVANRALEIFRNKQLKLASRPDETEDAFLARCDEAGQAKADEEAVKLTKRLEAKKDRLQNALELAATPGGRARHADEVAAGQRADLGRRCGARRPLRRQAQRPIDHERRRLGGLEAWPDGDDVGAAEHCGGEGTADERRPRTARAGDHRRGHRQQRQVEGSRRGHRDGVDQARGHRCARHRREVGLGPWVRPRPHPLVLVAAIALLAAGCRGDKPSASIATSTAILGDPATVAYVNDGDTLRTTSGKKVRLVQIDAPELHGDCFGKAALSALRKLTPEGTRITLVSDPRLDQTDRYGRLLRYVIVHGTNANVALVREGAASPYFFRNERGRYADDLLAAVEKARMDRLGYWGACPKARLNTGVGSLTGPG